MKQPNWGTTLALCVLTGVAAANITLLACGEQFNRMLPEYAAQKELYGKLGQIQAVIDQRYVGEYQQEDLLNMASAGMVVGTGDIWSTYLNADEYKDYNLRFAGQLVGIGIAVSHDQEAETVIVTDVYDGSPAEKAGLRPGDHVLAADGTTLADDGYDALLEAVRGEEGSKVSVQVRHPDGGEETLTIRRAKVERNAVRAELLDGHVGYLRISDFDGGADVQFAAERDRLIAQGADALIFDVRFNPGGSVTVLRNMLDPLLPEGDIIRLEPKDGAGATYVSDAEELGLPMAVLVNGQSISAAEFFAAALQEYGKAVVVGEKTIGKGYSQRPYELSDGSAVILSDQKYYTPKGRNLAGVGIAPDIEVALTEEQTRHFYQLDAKSDPQIQAALAALER